MRSPRRPATWSLPSASRRDSEVLQLAAYCLLVEETQGQRPAHGLTRYQNQTFAVDYTSHLRATAGGRPG